MSLSSALSNALSGLTASSRGASVISSNLSNILTEGYGVRDVSLSARSIGSDGGVTVNGVTRRVDSALIGDRRLSDAEQSYASVKFTYFERMAALIGDPTDASSLTGLLAEFEADLISAANLPESEIRLQSVLSSATALTETLNELSSNVQGLRTEADRAIEARVDALNTALAEIQQLNKDIVAAGSQSRETAGLWDQRQVLIDQVSAIVPVKDVARDKGAVALMTPEGAMLLDGNAAEIGFQARNAVTPGMSLENGLLSAITVNGSSANIDGGELGGLLAMRDRQLPELQSQLDTVARDLIDRFAGLDSTLPSGAPGLFTDSGSDGADSSGIAARISINALADPDQGGEVWRLRAGLGATQAGEAGDAQTLSAMVETLQQNFAPTGEGLGSQKRSAAILVSDFMSAVALSGSQIERQLSFASARQNELSEMEAAQGVDSDAELRKLLIVEQVYAANAKLIQAVDEMLEQLMEIA